MAITVSETRKLARDMDDLGTAKRALSRLNDAHSVLQQIAEEHSRLVTLACNPAAAQFHHAQGIAESLGRQASAFIERQRQYHLEVGSAMQAAARYMQFHDEFQKSDFARFKAPQFDFQRILRLDSMQAATESIIRGHLDKAREAQAAVNKVFESYEAAMTACDASREMDVPLLPIKPQPNNGGAYECLARLKGHIADAEQKAEAKGGYVLTLCKTPEGQILRDWHLEALDAYFISVVGIDIDGEERDFVTHFCELHISISIRDKDDFEEEPPPTIN